MNELSSDPLDQYYQDAETWSADRQRDMARSQKIAWIVASVATAVALLEAIALIVLLPLKTVVPYTLLVDRQTGYVQELKPLEREIIAPDRALVRSFLAQYVIARESFDINSLKDDYRKVALWSAGEARGRYVASAQASNPASPLATLPRQTLIEVEIKSITSLSDGTALVRFMTQRSDPGRQPQPAQSWAAVIKYRFSGEAMQAADRLINPLGFQVVRYRKSMELAPRDTLDTRDASPARDRSASDMNGEVAQ